MSTRDTHTGASHHVAEGSGSLTRYRAGLRVCVGNDWRRYQARRREQTFRWEMESLQRTTEWRVFKEAVKRMELKARRIHAQMQAMKWNEVLALVRRNVCALAAGSGWH